MQKIIKTQFEDSATPHINHHIRTLKPYIPISHKVWECAHREDILKLDWNESTIPPSPLVTQGLYHFLDHGFLQWYPDTHNTELYALLAKYARVDSEQIEIFGGSDCAHEYILQVFLDTGDKALIVAPTYDNFRSRAQGIGITTHFFYLTKDFMLDFDALDRAIIHHTPQMVYICNPNNPTGIVYDSVQLQNLIQTHSNTMFLIDEAYYEFCAQTLAPLTVTHKNLIITRTFSKAFGLASFRIGYCISHAQNIALLNKLRNPKSLSALAQVAAIHALKDESYMWAYVKEVQRAKEWFDTQIRSLGIKTYHSAANFILISHTHDLCRLLERHHIYIRDYRHIIPNHFRITIGTHTQMQKVYKALNGGGVAPKNRNFPKSISTHTKHPLSPNPNILTFYIRKSLSIAFPCITALHKPQHKEILCS
ncbi:pyridoxal phosphate-dependent aminotransferase [uncultured Helicobacter sp.]|uniref:pyridoxal phosphate-dependent aminotransferase n=1 Tax=uncultured Helicobacter sp. TaxID=175537 RepID=UPI00375076C6